MNHVKLGLYKTQKNQTFTEFVAELDIYAETQRDQVGCFSRL